MFISHSKNYFDFIWSHLRIFFSNTEARAIHLTVAMILKIASWPRKRFTTVASFALLRMLFPQHYNSPSEYDSFCFPLKFFHCVREFTCNWKFICVSVDCIRETSSENFSLVIFFTLCRATFFPSLRTFYRLKFSFLFMHSLWHDARHNLYVFICVICYANMYKTGSRSSTGNNIQFVYIRRFLCGRFANLIDYSKTCKHILILSGLI